MSEEALFDSLSPPSIFSLSFTEPLSNSSSDDRYEQTGNTRGQYFPEGSSNGLSIDLTQGDLFNNHHINGQANQRQQQTQNQLFSEGSLNVLPIDLNQWGPFNNHQQQHLNEQANQRQQHTQTNNTNQSQQPPVSYIKPKVFITQLNEAHKKEIFQRSPFNENQPITKKKWCEEVIKAIHSMPSNRCSQSALGKWAKKKMARFQNHYIDNANAMRNANEELSESQIKHLSWVFQKSNGHWCVVPEHSYDLFEFIIKSPTQKRHLTTTNTPPGQRQRRCRANIRNVSPAASSIESHNLPSPPSSSFAENNNNTSILSSSSPLLALTTDAFSSFVESNNSPS